MKFLAIIGEETSKGRIEGCWQIIHLPHVVLPGLSKRSRSPKSVCAVTLNCSEPATCRTVRYLLLQFSIISIIILTGPAWQLRYVSTWQSSVFFMC